MIIRSLMAYASGAGTCCFSVLLVAGTGCGGTSDTLPTTDLGSTTTLTLKNVPTGCPTTETAADLYSSVVMNNCAVASCHGPGGTSFQLSSAADLHTKWVGQRSTLYSGVTFPLVTAGSVDKSFLMYKITGSQDSYGSRMPNTGTALTSAQICKFVAWIESGAN